MCVGHALPLIPVRLGVSLNEHPYSASLGEDSLHMLVRLFKLGRIDVQLVMLGEMYKVTGKMGANYLTCQYQLRVYIFILIGVNCKILSTVSVLDFLVCIYVYSLSCLYEFFQVHSQASLVLLIPSIVLRQQLKTF